jgi:hypothetical protein
MKIRPAKYDELGVDREFVYYEHCVKNQLDNRIVSDMCPIVTLIGFVRSYKSPTEEGDERHDMICVIQKPDGKIILALENQLFVRIWE